MFKKMVEKYDYKLSQTDLIDFAREINSKIFNNELEIPKIIIKNNIAANHLGRAVQDLKKKISTGEIIREIWIEIQGRVLQDPEEAKKVMAHELIHIWQFQQEDLNEVVARMRLGKVDDKHGESFERWMNKINAEYGENYVMKTGGYSEKSPSKDYYLVIEPSKTYKGRFGYSFFSRPVPTLKDEIKRRIAQGREIRIVKTNEDRWLNGEKFKAFGALSIPKDEADQQKLKELYDNGKQEIFEAKNNKIEDETEISKVDDDVYVNLEIIESVNPLDEELNIKSIKWSYPSDKELMDEFRESDIDQLLLPAGYPQPEERKEAFSFFKENLKEMEIDPKQLEDDNAWRFRFKSYKDFKDQVKSYGGPKDPDSMLRKIQSGGELPMPVVIQKTDGSLRLAGGATRVAIASLAGQKIKALVIEETSALRKRIENTKKKISEYIAKSKNPVIEELNKKVMQASKEVEPNKLKDWDYEDEEAGFDGHYLGILWAQIREWENKIGEKHE